jgi:hypothetical protein
MNAFTLKIAITMGVLMSMSHSMASFHGPRMSLLEWVHGKGMPLLEFRHLGPIFPFEIEREDLKDPLTVKLFLAARKDLALNGLADQPPFDFVRYTEHIVTFPDHKILSYHLQKMLF